MRLLNLVYREALRVVAPCYPVTYIGEYHRDVFQYDLMCEIGGVGTSSTRAIVCAQTQKELESTGDITVRIVAVLLACLRRVMKGYGLAFALSIRR